MFREEGLEEDAIPIEWSRVVQEGLSEEEVFQVRLNAVKEYMMQAEKNILKGLEAKGFCVGESAFLENVVGEAARDI